MDKMGGSSKAGNKGIPATPRNGAPIELTSLLKFCLDFVATSKSYPFKEVTT
jgi:glycogen debranching enzyme